LIITALIFGIVDQAESLEKLSGYKQALQDSDISLNIKWIISGENTIEGGSIAAKKLLKLKIIPDSIFIANDLMAFGAMDAIKSEGYLIPSDIAIVGYDNSRMSPLVEPKLTTVIHPVNKMGLMAARLLFDTIEEIEPNNESYKSIYFESKLKVRKSCDHQERLLEIFD